MFQALRWALPADAIFSPFLCLEAKDILETSRGMNKLFQKDLLLPFSNGLNLNDVISFLPPTHFPTYLTDLTQVKTF